MKHRINWLLCLLLFSITPLLAAQEGPGMDFMRSTGKIYVVVAVIVVGFIGLICFLFYMDKKSTKLEDQIINHGKS